jgi:carbamoyltransferase
MPGPRREDKRIALTEEQKKLFGIDLLNVPRSKLPSITHVDYSARIQTVGPENTPRFYNLLKNFGLETDCPILINTSFNVRREPIVCTPEQAYLCFVRTEMDFLVLEDMALLKAEQTPLDEDTDWRNEFELD